MLPVGDEVKEPLNLLLLLLLELLEGVVGILLDDDDDDDGGEDFSIVGSLEWDNVPFRDLVR
jgi:hypothetical protein